jgi:hypothetical protein
MVPSTEQSKPRGRGRAVARGLLIRLLILIYALGAWRLLTALSVGHVVVAAHAEAISTAQPRSAIQETRFELPHFLPELTLQTAADRQIANVRWQLLDGSGRPLCGWPVQAGRHSSTFSVGRGFSPGRYVMRVSERGACGSYSVTLFAKPPLTGRQNGLLILLTTALLSSSGYALLLPGAKRGRFRQAGRWMGAAFGLASFSLLALLLYPLLHEGGHALAAAAFGVYDPAGSDLLGLRGEPHASGMRGLEGVAAAPHAIISSAGPLLPTLVAYLSFALWRSRWGKRVRGRAPVADAFWCGLTAVLLFGHLGLLLPLAGLMQDADYRGFAEGSGPWHIAARALVVILALVNSALIVALLRHLRGVWRGRAGMDTDAHT